MASNPPFTVEDNTDEDFFDKLVNDDDDVDFKVTTSTESGAHHVLTDGNESDEAKAFANLSINELDDQDEVNVEHVSSSDRSTIDDIIAKVETVEQINKVETGDKRGIPLVSADSFEFGNLMQKLGNENGGADVSHNADNGKTTDVGVSDVPTLSKTTSGLGAAGVKEVAWSAFNADSVQNDSNGFGSYSDFFTEFGGANAGDAFSNTVGVTSKNGPQDAIGNDVHGSSYVDNTGGQYNNEHNDGIAANQSSTMQDLSSTQYWENQYPGWKYDHSTGQWYQVDGYDVGSSVQANADSNVTSTWGGGGGQVDLSYMQQTSHSVSGAVAEAGITETVSNWNQTSLASDATEATNWNQVSEVSGDNSVVSSDWNQASNDNNGYPAHMVFDPQYPGWYYDTIAQEWRALESYAPSAQSTAQVHDQMNKDDYSSTDMFSHNNNLKASSLHDQGNNYNPQGFGSQSPDQNWVGSVNNYNQQNSRVWLPDNAGNTGEAALPYTETQVTENNYAQNVPTSLHGSQQSNVHYGVKGPYYENLSQHQNDYSMPSQFVGGNFSQQQFNDSKVNQNDPKYFSNDYYSNQNSVNFSQQQIQKTQMTYNPASGRSSAGRPAHALVAFGFGGKLIVMKHNNSSESMNFGSQNPVGGSISVLNLSEVVTGSIDNVNHVRGVSTYFQALCRHSLPGPLTGGSVATKELNKWIEERLTNSESTDMDYRKAQVLRLLLSLLKIACQFYGKLRSPYGTDAVMKESDAPESAVAKLFASAKTNGMQFNQYGNVTQCLQQLPSEGQLQATAAEVQNLLVSGRKKEALQCAQEGQLWGPALVLAAQLGDQFYVETVKQMALRQLVAGSPLRTLCLLIAGQPADVFSADITAANNMAGAVNVPQQPAQFGANCMLDDWEENLAVITANRTKDDELVLIHLGDCLWKERSDIIAAHICYLVAEASFEPYSDSARLCLIGADHWKSPRTYAGPEAIQRTEIYEYSKTLGNSQFVLLPFQPYKYVYALMLAEVGRTSEALKYCQAVLKSLKTGRTLELENLRNLVSSLEERIKAHQQGGFSVNLAPKEFIGKLLNLFDSTAHRVVGGLPPPIPTAGGAVHGNESHYQSTGPRVSSSQSTMAMSSLVPQSMEPINEWAADNKKIMHTRSVSEPDFGRSPMQSQADPSKEASPTGTQDKASVAGGTSRLGRFSFGSQLFQKTVGLVLKPRQGRQAKLGETNKFRYDDKLKRWVEEGAEPPAPEAVLPPPPKAAVFQNGASEMSSLQNEPPHNNGNLEFKSPSTMDNSSGMPPLPPTANQYSARGRIGVRARYVDTFNRGGGNTVSGFQSPSVPSAKPAGGVNPKFFVPTPVSPAEQPVVDTHVEEKQNASTTYENPSSSPPNDSFHSPPPSSSMAAMQRFGSMSNIYNKGGSDNSFASHSRRTASWGGSLNDSMSPPNKTQPVGEATGMRPSMFMPSDTSLADSSVNGGSFGEDLQEVEL
ncbi:protein transport protein SEC16B homolog [Salvia miltiorrhiza]|uniref:protein transport protein SEC16B homolog n=1 Tax=Salvia miltiorrhiza TaxID=226208 RepID=UPI0025AC7DCC|nr:protein transport protein SEC16B homolog [Salvia miltiorrhiza]XP_057786973.1 protein transport protein SEC16B homolog [Salvia miltiorrhiza]XP_057786974.1 protein transport protein SEC16B homolog [Salvia miltiorrhiza]